MRGTAFSPGQMAEFTNAANSAFAVALLRVAAKFSDPKAVLGGIKDKSEILAGRLESAVEHAIRSMLSLFRHPQRSVTITECRDPDAYYREGLWVYDGFRRLIVTNAKPVDAGAIFKVNEDELRECMTNAQIEAGLRKYHLFDESAVSAIIAELIESDKLDKHCFYILYTEACVVRVTWFRVYRKWVVNAWERQDFEWCAGRRVLSPAN
jgi:hypothetical protein